MSQMSHVTFPKISTSRKKRKEYKLLIINILYTIVFFFFFWFIGNVTCDKCDIPKTEFNTMIFKTLQQIFCHIYAHVTWFFHVTFSHENLFLNRLRGKNTENHVTSCDAPNVTFFQRPKQKISPVFHACKNLFFSALKTISQKNTPLNAAKIWFSRCGGRNFAVHAPLSGGG